MISFRGKGSRKAVLSSNLRTLDTQNKVRLISQPPQEIFFLLDLGIFCYVDTIASRSKHDFIFPSSSFKRNQSHLSFSFFEEKCFVCFFLFFVYHPLEKFEVNTHTIHFVSRCQSCDNRY